MAPLIASSVQKAEFMFGPAFAAQVEGHAERHAEMLEQLRGAEKPGKGRHIQHRILRSFSSRLVCLARSLPEADGWTPDRIMEVAACLDAWKDPGEIVKARSQPKTSGDGWRPICRFGPRRKALQTLCADILDARFGDDPSNYLAKGRGPDRASDHINYLINGAGFTFFVLADIKNFFSSVQQTSLHKALGLPEAVIQNCILIGPEVFLMRIGDTPTETTPTTTTIPCHDVFDRAVRQGLPQGSRASNPVASVLLGTALREITSADRILVHGDDIAVAARDEDEGGALKEALSEVLASHPAGPFCLKQCDLKHVNQGFVYLKYRHRRDPFTGAVKRTPAAKCYARFYEKVLAIVLTEPLRVAIKRVVLYRRQWMSAFPRWHRTEMSKFFIFMQIQELIRTKAPGKWKRLLIGRTAGGW